MHKCSEGELAMGISGHACLTNFGIDNAYHGTIYDEETRVDGIPCSEYPQCGLLSTNHQPIGQYVLDRVRKRTRVLGTIHRCTKISPSDPLGPVRTSNTSRVLDTSLESSMR